MVRNTSQAFVFVSNFGAWSELFCEIMVHVITEKGLAFTKYFWHAQLTWIGHLV